MHVRIRVFGKPDTVVVVESKLTKIDQFRKVIKEKFNVPPTLQRLFYGGKLLENGYTFHDYNIKLNDVIQLMAKVQLDETPKKHGNSEERETKTEEDKADNKNILYKDAKSTLYAIGDLVDARDSTSGAWLEGKIDRIVVNPDIHIELEADTSSNGQNLSSLEQNEDKENDLSTSPELVNSENYKIKRKGIAKFFTKTTRSKIQAIKDTQKKEIAEENLLFRVQFEDDEKSYYKLKDIRPRARTELDVKDLTTGQLVMINHNVDDPLEQGDWYDFKIDKINKLRKGYELCGTLYLGLDAIPQNDTTVRVVDKIFQIETVVPLADRTEEYKEIISTVPEKRSQPLNCMTCRDDFDLPCKDCGCYLCLGKEEPENILLCDECNNGFHMKCLSPPVTEIPDEDWYCPSCKRDPTDVVAPGAAKQSKKTSASKSNRDWGRGMACVGKTKTCAMPPNHFGPIPGIEVGMCWRFRIQLSESGVHRPPVSGIHGRDVEGAYSIVLSGGYEDDVDHGNEFTYTGSGGRDLSGNKRTAEQSCDQTLTRENKALARNCAVKLDESGADAGDDWRQGKPVRVVRSYKMLKHFPKYAPKEGIRYDGIYKVVKYYPEKGLSGYRVWKYLLRRDDPSPAPWEPGAKQYAIVYPDGYLEAQAEKNSSKPVKGNKKRALQESNLSVELEDSPPNKKRKTTNDTVKNGGGSKKNAKVQKSSVGLLKKLKGQSPRRSPKKPQEEEVEGLAARSEDTLSADQTAAIKADTVNAKLWDECLDVCVKKSKQEFIEHVMQVFLCIICQEVAVNPVTTPCSHNFCLGCIKLAFKSTESQTCPYCRHALNKDDLQINETLRTALRTLLAGYDVGKK